ncbi:ATP-binding protein [Candidatus Sulfurimonas marisnigri]|uniref:ATP-binding protein n=1 Tax=Candidatus Sulfurimonas marisnigri TaxID=2740405 RepID=A0A7S7M0L6_9BACT|nr:ATP-binding protein [Candidatus Sulfurimonas marisnigri]QOY54871.1 ATP-binding protein [Candidatus Sulfurimonas marisnigri]
MEIFLEELYKTEISLDKFHYRKVFLDDLSYQINGISQSGKTKLVKNYLLSLKKSSYLYIDCSDIRIDIDELNKNLSIFCNKNKISTLVLDNYTQNIKIVNVPQLITCSEINYTIDYLKTLQLYPLDYEEFLAYEHKYDSTALNHFFQLGAFPSMHKVNSDERNLYIQKTLKYALDDMELDILVFCAKMIAQKISPFSIYERLKQTRKISKDKLYKSIETLSSKKYIHQLEKTNHAKATKKIYLCDISLKSALTIDKNFARLFENMIYLELLKSDIECFYDDGIDFYLPQSDEVILGMPFADERTLFKKMEAIEAFIFTHQVKSVTAVTMSREGSVSHPLSHVEMIPFDIWAIGD